MRLSIWAETRNVKQNWREAALQIKTCVRWISQFVFAVVFLSVLLIQAGLASATQVPTISPSGGEYTSSQTVTIGNIDSGDTAYYTTDGSNPKTSSTATEYSGSFTVSQSEIVRAAVKDSSGDWSSVTGARFIIDNQSTNSDSSQISELTQELVSAIDNNQMGEAMQLLMQIEQLSNQNLNNSDNWDNSSNYNESSSSSSIDAPTISPNGGEYTSSQTVTIGNIGSGDTAYYTTDRSDPRTSSTATEYSGSLTVSESEIVLAAVKDSSGDWSSVTGARFIIDNSSNSNYYNNGSNTNYDNNGSNGSNNWYSENRNRNRSRNQGSDYNIKNWDRNLDNNWDNNW
jgi:hypothetical protein